MKEIIGIFADIFASKGVWDKAITSDITFFDANYAILENRAISDLLSKKCYPQDYVLKKSNSTAVFFFDMGNRNYIVTERAYKGVDVKMHLLTDIDEATWNGICDILLIDRHYDVFDILKNRHLLRVSNNADIDICRSRLLCSMEYLIQAVNKLGIENNSVISPILEQIEDLQKNVAIVCGFEGIANLSDIYEKKYPQPIQMIGIQI